MSKRGWPHVDDPVSVGRRLKDARLAAQMSQRELAFPGCTAVYICRIERGDRVPSLQVLRELARRVGVSEEYLARGSEAVDEADPLIDADVALRLEQFELAEHLYTQALEATTDRVLRGRALGGLGEIDFHAGRLDDAVERLEEARTLLAESIAGYPGIVDSLARVYWTRDEYEVAIAVLEDALGLARGRADEQAEARFSVLLANVLIDSGSLSSARELLGKTLAKAVKVSDPILQARLYWSQSRLHSAEKNPEVAVRYARMALAAIELTDHTAYAARAHHLLAYIELELGNAEEALKLLERGYPLAVSSGGADARGFFRLEKARALAALGREDEAVVLANEVAGELAEDRPEQAGRAYAVAADVFARRDERRRALELYERAAELVTADRQPDFVRELYSKMAELMEADGRKDEALELLKRAVGLQSQVPQGQA
jgi:tetratricopeptide (TPR) repeat protein